MTDSKTNKREPYKPGSLLVSNSEAVVTYMIDEIETEAVNNIFDELIMRVINLHSKLADQTNANYNKLKEN